MENKSAVAKKRGIKSGFFFMKGKDKETAKKKTICTNKMKFVNTNGFTFEL